MPGIILSRRFLVLLALLAFSFQTRAIPVHDIKGGNSNFKVSHDACNWQCLEYEEISGGDLASSLSTESSQFQYLSLQDLREDGTARALEGSNAAQNSDSEEASIIAFTDYKTFNFYDDAFPLPERLLRENRRLQRKAFERIFGNKMFRKAAVLYGEISCKRRKEALGDIVTYATLQLVEDLIKGDDDAQLNAAGLIKYCADYNIHPYNVKWWNSLGKEDDQITHADEEELFHRNE